MKDLYNRKPEPDTKKNILISEAEFKSLIYRSKKPYTSSKRKRFFEGLPNEIWKEIPDTFGMYEISNLGRLVKHHCCDRYGNTVPYLIEPKIYNGFQQCVLALPSGSRRVYIHKVVKKTFEPTNDPLVRFVYHINGDTTDNRLCNLGYRKRLNRRNSKLKTKAVVNKYGDVIHRRSTLSVGDLQKIKEMFDLKVPQCEIAKLFNVSQSYISQLKKAGIRIINGKAYSYTKHLHE